MNIHCTRLRGVLRCVVGLMVVLGLSACGDSSERDDTGFAPSEVFTPPAARTVVGTVDVINGTLRTTASRQAVVHRIPTGTTIVLDDQQGGVPVGSDGSFQVMDIDNGDHSLFVHLGIGEVVQVPFRILGERGLNLGTVVIRNGHIEEITGFNGYRVGFVDEDGDGMNDLCVDADGNGVCDAGTSYADYAYLMSMGYLDQNADGMNDRFGDADGDGINDVTGMPYGHGFGFLDADSDGINDRFADADGDGICDLTGMPFRHPFGYVDADGDGMNDRFSDADGDGVNDVTGVPYVAMPGWVDLDGDGVNDLHRDEDGDGINDVTGMPYRHGFAMAHVDDDGNGIDDSTGMPYGHGFGWVDADGDGVNDAFVDGDGDGVNDRTGHSYTMGFRHSNVDVMDHIHSPVEWPVEPPMHSEAPMGGGML
jgi:hypothetical protein